MARREERRAKTSDNKMPVNQEMLTNKGLAAFSSNTDSSVDPNTGKVGSKQPTSSGQLLGRINDQLAANMTTVGNV